MYNNSNLAMQLNSLEVLCALHAVHTYMLMLCIPWCICTVVHVYSCLHMYILYTQTHTCIHIWMHTYLPHPRPHSHTPTHIYTQTHIHAHTHTSTPTNHTHTHTHIHTHLLKEYCYSSVYAPSSQLAINCVCMHLL